MALCVPAEKLSSIRLRHPVVLFLGVSTAGSAVHRYFPQWSRRFPEPMRLVGVDLPAAAAAPRYQELLDFISDTELIRGMVITSHKIGLFRAGTVQISPADSLCATLGELSALRRTPGGLLAHATDPLSSRAAAAELAPCLAEGDVVCLGAGGAAVALTAALTLPADTLRAEPSPAPREPPGSRPPAAPGALLPAGRIHVTDISPDRLSHLMHVAECLGVARRVVPHLQRDASGNDAVLAAVQHTRLVVNATGLGKETAESPLTDEAVFPRHAVIWDMNYRGPLTFMGQARAQEHARGLQIADGWRFFLHGWTNALAPILGVTPDDPALVGIIETPRASQAS